MISLQVYFVKIILFLSIIFITIFSWLSGENIFHCPKPAIEATAKMHRMLNSISTECRQGKFEYAQNTYLELHLELQRMEVSNKRMRLSGSFTSDSLAILGQMIDKAAQSPHSNIYSEAITFEIRRITGQLDVQSLCL